MDRHRKSTRLGTSSAYALAGYEVFPLRPGTKEPYGGTHGMLDATTDLDTIRHWWDEHPGSNIGLRPAQDQYGIDVDTAETHASGFDGYATLAQLVDAVGPPPADAPTVETPSGGLHIYLPYDGGELADVLGPGIDIKGHGGYLVAPPSVIRGKPYRWRVPLNGAPPRADAWTARARVAPKPAPRQPADKQDRGTFLLDGDSVIHAYNADTSWTDILTGWTCRDGRGDDDGAVWLHPTHTSNCSATISGGRLYVYTPNTPFEQTTAGYPRGYDKFDAYTLLNHRGDASAAAKALWNLRNGHTAGATGLLEVKPNPADAAAPVWAFIDGATFILDIPATIPALWGDGNDVLWAEGESLMVAGPMGLGKTTLLGLLIRAQLGIDDRLVLGQPVAPRPGNILYLAMDRPAQIARALRRQFSEAQRRVLAERLKVWKGPPPADVAKNPAMLLALAQAANAETVYLDSIKDAAIGLSDDEVGAGYNRARQLLLANGVQLAEAHHTTKRAHGGGPPNSVADIYGSAWITNGTGSIALLSGDPGDPIVGFRHVRAPADELGPWRLLHDQRAGLLTVEHHIDVRALAEAYGGKITAKQAAAAIYETDNPSRGQIGKAGRRLNDLVPATFTRIDGAKGGGKNARPSVWLLAGVDPTAFVDLSLFDAEGGSEG